MAIFKEQDKDRELGQAGSTAQATITSGGAGNAGAAGGAPTPQTGSGRWTNISRYMNANQGNQAIAGATNDLEDQGANAGRAYQHSKAAFEGLRVNAPQSFTADEDRMVQDAFSSDDNATLQRVRPRINSLQAKYNAGVGYNGPTAADVNAKANNLNYAAQQADKQTRTLADTQQGADLRTQFFKDRFGADGNYTSGQGRLDNFLAENQGRPQWSATQAALSEMGKGYDEAAIGERQNQLARQAQSATDNREDMKARYGGVWDTIRNKQQMAPVVEATSREAEAKIRTEGRAAEEKSRQRNPFYNLQKASAPRPVTVATPVSSAPTPTKKPTKTTSYRDKS